MKIPERDNKFLLMLNETGACNSKMPLTIYPKRYCRNKLESMEKDKIIIRKYDLITLGVNGKSYLESIGVLPNIVATKPIASQRRLARALELKYLLPNMKVVSSAVYKRENNLNRGMQFVAAATTRTSTTYLIYDVPKILTVEAKSQILRELKNKKGVISNVIIFTRNMEFVQMLSASNVYVSELLLLVPNDLCINLVNYMGEGDFDRKVISSAFPELIYNRIFMEKRNNYIVDNNTYFNFVLNNISIFGMLSSIDLYAVKNNITSYQTYIIVCLDIQRNYINSSIEKLKFKKITIKIATIARGQTSFY